MCIKLQNEEKMFNFLFLAQNRVRQGYEGSIFHHPEVGFLVNSLK